MGLASVLVAGCDLCGPPAEPLIDIVVIIDAATDHHAVHASMFNAAGGFVTGAEDAATPVWRYKLGNCDGARQSSGAFRVVAWVDTVASREQAPAGSDPQGMDVVEVTCSDGCYAAREARITIP